MVEAIYDLAKEDGVRRLNSADGTDPLHLLVNNAGMAVVKLFTEITTPEWNDSFALNVTAPFLLMQQFAPLMPPGADIVNILSIAAKQAYPGWSVIAPQNLPSTA